MERIEYLENNKQIKLLPELIIELFKNEDFDELIYNYLDKKGINELGSTTSVHNKFLELSTQKYKQQKLKNNFELRNKIWNFLLFSSFYDKTKALKLFKEGKDKDEFFVEKLFIRANENNSIECLNELANIFELNENMGEILVDAAELLCTRFPSPEMLKPLLTLHLLISKYFLKEIKKNYFWLKPRSEFRFLSQFRFSVLLISDTSDCFYPPLIKIQIHKMDFSNSL
ncbi:unnamed protein product [Meloidogyne enterolobii]|uniref:Uncharacterized protein n=1 Tax=Meloidogyne enterolobii TaxID=390850 RepID=A0ACB0YG28_MELEN